MSDSPSKILEILKRGTVEMIREEELVQKLAKGKPLRVKAGFDPTAPDLHLGHTVLLQKMKQFQDLGHQVIFLIGDFTGMIGDPTGVSETRKVLSQEQVEQNAGTYEKQVFKILDRSKTEVRFNSEWLGRMTAREFAALGSKHTVARMLERDDFKKRFKGNQDISILEFYYPLIQGYDSVVLEADIELGGTDQKFNLLMGRTMQSRYGKEPQVVMTIPLLLGTDGVQKMSKSYGNYIGITESAKEMVGKIMSLSDTTMWTYFELLSDKDLGEIAQLKKDVEGNIAHPKEVKKQLAFEIAKRFHGEAKAQDGIQEFAKVFENRGVPTEIEEAVLPGGNGLKSLVDLLLEHGLVESKSDARRLIQQKAVTVNDKKVETPDASIPMEGEYLIRVGKRRFKRLKFLTK